MINVSELSDEQKSVMLAQLCGWEKTELKIGKKDPLLIFKDQDGFWFQPVGINLTLNIYVSGNMSAAWRVLNWAMKNLAEKFWRDFDFSGMCFLSPAAAQRTWLDKILELAIEAGLVNGV